MYMYNYSFFLIPFCFPFPPFLLASSFPHSLLYSLLTSCLLLSPPIPPFLPPSLPPSTLPPSHYSMLATKLNLTEDDAERWIVNLIRNARLDAKIDAKKVHVLWMAGWIGRKTNIILSRQMGRQTHTQTGG